MQGLIRSTMFILQAAVVSTLALGTAKDDSLKLRTTVLNTANELLESSHVSYAYGGSKIGSIEECKSCNRCLQEKKPSPKRRLTECKACQKCSIDCSHFTAEVFKQSGLKAPYLTTSMMQGLSDSTLKSNFHLISIGRRLERALPGDLIVYDGHVVMLLALKPNQSPGKPALADIIHSTSGREVKGAGQGIQRARNVSLTDFKGPIKRILRHVGLANELRKLAMENRGIRKLGTKKP